MSDPVDQDIGPFAPYYHKNIAAFGRILEHSPPGTFSPDEIRANHYAAGGVLLTYDLPDIEALLNQPQPEEGLDHEYDRPDGDAGADPAGAVTG